MVQEISTLEDLDNIRNDKHGRYKLVEDIDASASSEMNDGQGFEPLFKPNMDGNTAQNTGFQGVLLGNGHTITGLKTGAINGNVSALFGLIGNGAKVTDLTIEDATIEGHARHKAVIAGVNKGAITDCDVSGTIGYDGGYTGNGYVRAGGIAGLNKQEVYDCTSSCDIGTQDVGSQTGGICGSVESASIYRVEFSGNIVSQGISGGIVGGMASSGDNSTTVRKGEVTSSARVEGENAGGVVGDANIDISECYCDAEVEGTTAVAALALTAGQVNDCRASATIVGAGTKHAFVGTLEKGMNRCITQSSAGSGSVDTALIDTDNSGGSVNNSFWNSDVVGSSVSVAGEGIAESHMTGTDIHSGFSNYDTNNHWIFRSGETPTLQLELYIEVASLSDLDNIRNNMGANYVLTQDIDASDTRNQTWGSNGAEGFEPIGRASNSNAFTGTFDGQGNSINGLYISDTGNEGEGIAMFSVVESAAIRNVELNDFEILASEDFSSWLIGLSSEGNVTGSGGHLTLQNISANGCRLEALYGGGGFLGDCYGPVRDIKNLSVDNCTVVQGGDYSSLVLCTPWETGYSHVSNISITNSEILQDYDTAGWAGALCGMMNYFVLAENIQVENVTVEGSTDCGILMSEAYDVMLQDVVIRDSSLISPFDETFDGHNRYARGTGGAIASTFSAWGDIDPQTGAENITVENCHIQSLMGRDCSMGFGYLATEHGSDVNLPRAYHKDITITGSSVQAPFDVSGFAGEIYDPNIENIEVEGEVIQDGRNLPDIPDSNYYQYDHEPYVSPFTPNIATSPGDRKMSTIECDVDMEVRGYDGRYDISRSESPRNDSVIVAGFTGQYLGRGGITLNGVKTTSRVTIIDSIVEPVDVAPLYIDQWVEAEATASDIGVDIQFNDPSKVRDSILPNMKVNGSNTSTMTVTDSFFNVNKPTEVKAADSSMAQFGENVYLTNSGNIDSSQTITEVTKDEITGESASDTMALNFDNVWATSGGTPTLTEFIIDFLSIYAEIQDSYGNPLEGEAIGINGQPIDTTNSDGVFTIEAEPGVVQELNWITAGVDRDIEQERGQVELTLQYLTLEGTVTDVNGNTIEDEAIVLDNKFMFETGPDGTYTAEDIPPQYYNARWVGGNVETPVGGPEGGVMTEDFQYAGLNVTIEHPLKSEPLPNTTVQVDNTLLTTDENGEATITELPIGEYRVTAMGFWDINTNEINQGVMKEVDFSGADLDLTVGVDVISRETGEPLEGVDVAITRANSMGETDSNGHCELFAAGLDEDPELIVASDDPRYATQIRELYREEERMDFEIVLSKRTPMER